MKQYELPDEDNPRTAGVRDRAHEHQTYLIKQFAQRLAAFLEYDTTGVQVQLANVLGFKYYWDDQRNMPVATFHHGQADWVIWHAAPPAAAGEAPEQWRIAFLVNHVPRATFRLVSTDTLLSLIRTYH